MKICSLKFIPPCLDLGSSNSRNTQWVFQVLQFVPLVVGWPGITPPERITLFLIAAEIVYNYRTRGNRWLTLHRILWNTFQKQSFTEWHVGTKERNSVSCLCGLGVEKVACRCCETGLSWGRTDRKAGTWGCSRTSQRSVAVCRSCTLTGSRSRTRTSRRPPVAFVPQSPEETHTPISHLCGIHCRWRANNYIPTRWRTVISQLRGMHVYYSCM